MAGIEGSAEAEVRPARTDEELNAEWEACCKCLRAIQKVLAALAQREANVLAETDEVKALKPCKGHGWSAKVTCNYCGETGKEPGPCPSVLVRVACRADASHEEAMGYLESRVKKGLSCTTCTAESRVKRGRLAPLWSCGDNKCASVRTDNCAEHGMSRTEKLKVTCHGKLQPCEGCKAFADSLADLHKSKAIEGLAVGMVKKLAKDWDEHPNRGWSVLQVFNKSPGYQPVTSPEHWDIPGIVNTLNMCRPLADRLQSISRVLVATSKFRNQTMHSPTLEKNQRHLDEGIVCCGNLLDKLEELEGFKEHAAASLARARRVLERVEQPPPAHLKSICAAACRPQVVTDSFRDITTAVDRWIAGPEKPIMWVSGQRGSGKSFAAGQIYYERPRSVAHFYRQDQNGTTAARQLLAQLTKEELSLDKGPRQCWEKMEEVELKETVLMIVDGLDEELRADDSISSILSTLTTWNLPQVRLLVTSIDPPPEKLRPLVQHEPITVGQSARQLIEAYVRAPLCRNDERYATALARVEEEASKDLNYVSLFFNMCSLELQDSEGADTLEEKEAGKLLERMLAAQPIGAVYEEHVKRCMFSMPGGLVIHTVLGLMAAFGGVASPDLLKVLLQKTTAVDGALRDLQRAGLASQEEDLSHCVHFGWSTVVTLLPGFLSFLRHSDMAGHGTFETDYASVGHHLLKEEYELLLHPDNAFSCAITISYILRGSNSTSSATISAVDSELASFAVQLARDSEQTLRTDSGSLCLVIRALYDRDDTAKALATELWRDNVVGLITTANIVGTRTKLSGLLKFGRRLEHDTFAEVARQVRAPLFAIIRQLEPHKSDDSIDRYQGKLAKIPCSWARDQVGDPAEEAAAFGELLDARPHLADSHTVAELMRCLIQAGQYKQAIAAFHKFHWFCDYYGEEHHGHCGIEFVDSVWEERRQVRARQQQLGSTPFHAGLESSNMSVVLAQLARAHENLGQVEEIRQLLTDNEHKRPIHALGWLVKLLLRETPPPEEAVAEAERWVQSFLNGGQEMRLISCLAQVLASKDGSDFVSAKTELEGLCAASNNPTPLDQHCNYYLLRCGKEGDHLQEKAAHILLYSDDSSMWNPRSRKWFLPVFFAPLIATGKSTEAIDIAQRFDCTEALAGAVNQAVQRQSVDVVRELVDAYATIRPLCALDRLVQLWLPCTDRHPPRQARSMAERYVGKFLEGGKEPRLLKCLAHVLSKSGKRFEAAQKELEKHCAAADAPPNLPSSCHDSLLHCKGLMVATAAKAKYLRKYLNDDWEDIDVRRLGRFLCVLVDAKFNKEAKALHARFPELASNSPDIKDTMARIGKPAKHSGLPSRGRGGKNSHGRHYR